MTDYEVYPGYINSRISLYGYVKGHGEDDITIAYNYEKYEVTNVIGPGWFIDSEIPAKEVLSP
ncbi:hypothetical protein [Paenibacillus glacialis]|uniref:hypothetical protein n=1 Tax=Paenibacillus glacialis TaxID=494026 RepID=UPI001FE2179D|nr:hypothetical protein [Paenibacillus glacialis]